MSVEFQELIRLGLKDLADAIRDNKWNDRDRDYFVQEIYRTLKTLSGVPPGGAAGGDLTGTYPSPTIATNAVTTTKIIDDAVTFAKMQEITTDRLIGRDTASTGNPEELTVSGGVEFTGSGGIQRSALTGDVTASAGSNTTVIGVTAWPSQVSYLYALSDEKTAASADDWHELTNNAITLTPGTWEVFAGAFFGNNGSGPDYTTTSIIISTNNGDDTGTIPTAVATGGDITLKAGVTSINGLSGTNTYVGNRYTNTAGNNPISVTSLNIPPCLIAVSANTTIYCVSFSNQTTASRTRIFANIYARRISAATS